MGRKKKSNKILESHGDWFLVDISTDKFPNATMAVDADCFNNYNGGRIFASNDGTTSYIYASCNNQKHRSFHKLIIKTYNGFEIDHVKHGTMSFIDNRKSNLRVVTSRQNNMNKNSKRSVSGIRGVSLDRRGRWRVRMWIDGKNKHLGVFDNIEIAIGVRLQAEDEYYGEYSYHKNNSINC